MIFCNSTSLKMPRGIEHSENQYVIRMLLILFIVNINLKIYDFILKYRMYGQNISHEVATVNTKFSTGHIQSVSHSLYFSSKYSPFSCLSFCVFLFFSLVHLHFVLYKKFIDSSFSWS
jgi:hypothetical protein